MNGFFRWLFRRMPDGRKKCGWESCVWKEDVELSSAGLNAVIAGMWWPPATCTKCGATKEPINLQYAEKNGWLKKKARNTKMEDDCKCEHKDACMGGCGEFGEGATPLHCRKCCVHPRLWCSLYG